MDERDTQRRPTGVRWVCSVDFIHRLTRLLEGKTAGEVAQEVSVDIGYVIDDSMIRELEAARIYRAISPDDD